MLGFTWDTNSDVPAESFVVHSTPQYVVLCHLFKLCDTDMSGFTLLVHKNLLCPCLTRDTKGCDRT